MKKNIPTVIAAGVLVLILGLYMICYQVRFTDAVVVTTFGKPSEPVTEPGVYMKWPWPIQRVVRYDKRLRIVEGVEEELRTRDEQNLVVLAFAEWQIEDPMKFRETVDTISNAERQLRRLLDTYKKTAIGHYELAHFFSKDPVQLRYDAVEQEIHEPLARDARSQFGVGVTSVGIKRISLPAGATTEQVLNRMREEQNKLAAAFRAAGESEASRIRAEAESLSERIRAFTDRFAGEIETEGIRALAELHQAYQAHPEFARFLMDLEYLRDAFAQRVVYVLGEEHPGISIFRKPPELSTAKQDGAMAVQPSKLEGDDEPAVP